MLEQLLEQRVFPNISECEVIRAHMITVALKFGEPGKKSGDIPLLHLYASPNPNIFRAAQIDTTPEIILSLEESAIQYLALTVAKALGVHELNPKRELKKIQDDCNSLINSLKKIDLSINPIVVGAMDIPELFHKTRGFYQKYKGDAEYRCYYRQVYG